MHPPEKKTGQTDYIECPFCCGVVKTRSGRLKCSECGAVFRYDERMRGVFAEKTDIRLPVKGTLCVRCGLVQDADNERCRFCRAVLCKTVQ